MCNQPPFQEVTKEETKEGEGEYPQKEDPIKTDKVF